MADEEEPVLDEVALAVRAAGEASPQVRVFAESVGLLDPAREVVGGWTDRLHVRREARLARVITAAAEQLHELGVPATAVRDRVLANVLAGAADEDDPALSAIWSNLLANAAIGAYPVAPSFPTILTELEPIEARLLDAALRRQHELLPPAEVELDSLEGMDDLEWRHLDNLERLGLIAFGVELPVNVELPERPTRVHFRVNPFGEAFVNACSPPA